MRLHCRFSAIFAAACLAIPACLVAAPAAAAAAAVLQVKGSDTIGGKLGQDFAHAYMARHPEVEVKWEALGSGTAFVGLLDGSAQLGAASRAVKQGELADAGKLGIELREFVIGYDGIAVVVNPANPVTELTVAQLSDVFTGRVRDWSAVGGPTLPIHLISRPSYSGTFSFFRDKVLRRGNDKGPEDYATTAEMVEENGAILQKVAQDRGAISYVGIGWVTPAVKTIGVAARAGQPPVRASVATVRTGAYPIYRPLLPAEAPATATAGTVTAAGAAGARTRSLRSDAGPEVVRIQFPRGATLTDSARATLASLANGVKTSGRRLLVVGHADTRGSKAINARLSLARANAVAEHLAELGVPRSAIAVEAHGADDPVASNQRVAGRGSNRRVDVTILAPPAPPAQPATAAQQ